MRGIKLTNDDSLDVDYQLMTVTNSTFVSLSSRSTGGAISIICLAGCYQNVNISNSIFSNNKAKTVGGAVTSLSYDVTYR